jgi:GT2 family glycosyltransferase
MILHSVIVSYQRLELLRRTVESYLETVSVPYTLWAVDNGSSDEVLDYLAYETNLHLLPLGENRYPGFACNRGFERVDSDEVTHLHRSDSDMEYLPGWCEAALERFDAATAIVGLRTDEEELHTELNTGGTAVIRRDVWDEGLRYVETPWVDDMTEDWRLCQDAKKMGYLWTRVRRPAVVHLGAAHARLSDPYYQASFGARKIEWMLPP